MTMTMKMIMKICHLTINVHIMLSIDNKLSHLHKLQIGLETIAKTKKLLCHFNNSRAFDSNQVFVFLWSYGQHDNVIM